MPFPAQDENRIQQEIARIQAAATADLDRIRREAAEVSERELRTLRELRDAALDEAARLRLELRGLQGQHEELLLEHRDGKARLDVRVTELLGELKLKGFDLQRVQVGNCIKGNRQS
jgi:progesterone-induced-blocking factor 1